MRMAPGELGRLGMTDGIATLLGGALAAPSGLILIAGPARSGRSTTLAALAAAAPGALAVDPIEDRAAVLAALEAAGERLVLATVTAPGAVGAITALRALRIAPAMIAAPLRAVIGQGLAPRLCADCRSPAEADPSLGAMLGLDPGAFVYAPATGRGCATCKGMGWHGRVGLFEGFAVDAPLARLIAMDGDEAVIANLAFRDRPNLPAIARFMVRHGLVAAEDAVGFCRVAVRELA